MTTATQYLCYFSRVLPMMCLIKGRRSVAITGMSAKQLGYGLESLIMKYRDSPKTFRCPSVCAERNAKSILAFGAFFFQPTSSLGLSRAGSQDCDSPERIQIVFPSVNCHSPWQREIIVLRSILYV